MTICAIVVSKEEDAGLMADLLEMLYSAFLVILGILVGWFLTCWSTTRSETRQNIKRRKEVIQLIVGDIFNQLANMKLALEGIDTLLKLGVDKSNQSAVLQSNEELRVYSNFFGKDVFLSVLQDLALLPLDCLMQVISYYSLAEKLCQNISRYLGTGEHSSLMRAKDIGEEVVELAVDTLVELNVANGHKRAEAQKRVSEGLKALNRVAKASVRTES